MSEDRKPVRSVLPPSHRPARPDAPRRETGSPVRAALPAKPGRGGSKRLESQRGRNPDAEPATQPHHEPALPMVTITRVTHGKP